MPKGEYSPENSDYSKTKRIFSRLIKSRTAQALTIVAAGGLLTPGSDPVEAQPSAVSTPSPAKGTERSSMLNWSGHARPVSVNTNERTSASVRPGRTQPQVRASATQGEWNLGVINALPNAGGENQIVAVLSPGSDDHPDYQVVSRFNTVSAQPDGDRTSTGYGTLIAGLIAGRETGAAPGAKIISAEVLTDDFQGSYDTVAAGIRGAIDRGATGVVAPIGVPTSCPPVLQEAIDYAISRRVPVVASVGDRGLGIGDTPSNCRGVIAVQAVDRQRYLTPDSNFPLGAIAAAGGRQEDLIRSTSRNGGREAYDYGTGLAAGQVAGSLARLRQARPDLSVDQLVDWLEDNMSPVTGFPSAKGIVNVWGALNNVPSYPTNTPLPTFTPTPRPTETPTPTPTATKIPEKCNPRKPVQIVTVKEGSRMRVTVLAGEGSVKSVELLNPQAANGRFSELSQEITSPVLPTGVKEFSLTQIQNGRAVTASLRVTDDCGPWQTFVGAGPDFWR